MEARRVSCKRGAVPGGEQVKVEARCRSEEKQCPSTARLYHGAEGAGGRGDVESWASGCSG